MQGLPKAGDVLDDTYRIEELIGKGGFGAVYRATQLSMQREVALKILVAHALKVDEMIERFRREVMAVRNLGHPNTIRIYDFRDRADGLLYYAMEFVKGPTLEDIIEGEGPMSPRRAAHILRQTLKSLSEAHSYGIVHRDLKPANIMLADIAGETDFVKVLDFGIAKIIGGDDEEERDKLTNAGVLVGTLNYMSPEQIAGGEIGPASDLYALALIGVEMLTGRSVFAGTGRWEVLHKLISDEPVDIPSQVESSDLGPILTKALSKRQDERFPRAEDMLEALGELPTLSEEPLLGPDEIPDGPTRRVTVESEASDDEGVVEDELTQAAELTPASLSTVPRAPASAPQREPLRIAPPSAPHASTQPVESVRPQIRVPSTTPETQRAQPRNEPTGFVAKASPPPGETSPNALGQARKGNTGLIAIAVVSVLGILACLAILIIVLSDAEDAEKGNDGPEKPVVATTTDSPEPQTAGEIEITQLQIPQPTEKTVRLVTPDLEASVYRDGKLIGTTPMDLEIETTYTVRAEGYEEETVELAIGTDDVFDLRLRRRRGKVATSDSPPKAKTDAPTSPKEASDDDNGWVDVPIDTKKVEQKKAEEKKVEVPVF